MRFFNGCISTFFIALLPMVSVIAKSNEKNDFTPRISRQRTAGCPLLLNTGGLESVKLQDYLWSQALAELPHGNMNNNIKHKTDISSNQVLKSNGGYFVIRDNKNSVSQLYCDYTDADGEFFYLAFYFRSELTFHVKGFLPETPRQILFPQSGKKNCAALVEPNTPEKPHCQITLANILVTNQVQAVPVSGYSKNPEFYGHLSYKPTLEIAEFTGEPEVFDQKKKEQLIPPGATRAYPVSPDLLHGISVGVRMHEHLEDVSEACISSWLPKAQMLVNYGASPHILISGEVGYDGNSKQDFKCELRCNEKAGQRDCWDVSIFEKLGWYVTRGERPDLRRSYILSAVSEAHHRPEIDFSDDSDEALLRKYQALPYYKELGLKPDASTEEIKKAYRELNRQTHPDKVKEKNSQARHFAVQTAYNRLKILNNILDEEDESSGRNGKSHIVHDEL